MKPMQAIMAVTAPMIKGAVPDFGSGDTVRVSVKVVEGSRERTQVFEGVVMRKRGGGIDSNFTVRRIAAHGIGVERTFLLNSPRIEKIEVVRRGVVRRAQLYYLRGLTGKAARIKERRYRPGDKKSAVTTRTVVNNNLLVAETATDMTLESDAHEMGALDATMTPLEANMAADDVAADTDVNDTPEEETEA